MSTPEQQAEYRALLEQALGVAGSVSATAGALGRNPRTIHRWRTGDHPIPDAVVERIRAVALGRMVRPAPDLDAIRRLGEALTEGFAALAGQFDELAGKLKALLQEMEKAGADAGEEGDDADE